MPANAAAQQRSILNDSFESNNPKGPGGPSYEIYPISQVIGWISSTGVIELWDSNFNGVPAYEGLVFAEMNANAPGSLYQNVCMVNGETIGWQFAHRARSGGAATQNARFEIATSSGTVLQVLANQASTTTNQVWNLNTGTATYTGPSGTQRIQFTTTDPGSYGNFLDAIRINLRPFIQLNSAAATGAESIANANLPRLSIDGTVRTAFTVTITVTGGTAVLGTDYTTPNGAATFQVSVPAGIYNNTTIATGIQIIDDDIVEPSETINLSIGSGPSYSVASTTTCGGTATVSSVYTITDNDARVTMRKQWTNAAIGDSTTFSITRGVTVIDSFNSVVAAASQLGADTTPTAVVFGDTLTLAEVLGAGNAKGYISSLNCTGAADTNLADGLTIGAGETAITCTYTNTGIDALVVSKTSTIISDGVSAAGPKAIPGATMRYCISVTNPGVFAATNISAADPLPGAILFLIGTIRSGTSCSNATTVEDEDNIGPDETDDVGVQLAGTTIIATAASLAANTSIAVLFDAVVK